MNKDHEKPTTFKERFGSLFGSKKTEDSTVPAPGTPPTFNPDGSIKDPGNPWIGPIDPKYGYPTEGFSGAQFRRIRRAQQRREAAERRIGNRAYNRIQKQAAEDQAKIDQRARIVAGEVKISDGLAANLHRAALAAERQPTELEQQARRQQKLEDRQDRAADRRAARFVDGKPRGKDLREATYNEHESLLPTSARNRKR